VKGLDLQEVTRLATLEIGARFRVEYLSKNYELDLETLGKVADVSLVLVCKF